MPLVLSSRPVKGTAFTLCAAAHAVVLLMLMHAGGPAGPKRAIRSVAATQAARSVIVPVKFLPSVAQPRPDAILHAHNGPKANKTPVSRQHREKAVKPPPSPARPASPPIQASTKTVAPIASLLVNPIGQGSWGFASSTPVSRAEETQASIQQARAAIRMALMDRLSAWMGRQMQQGLNANCLIRFSQNSRQAHLSCTPESAANMLWPALTGLAIPGEPRVEDMVCIQAGNGRLGFVECDSQQGG